MPVAAETSRYIVIDFDSTFLQVEALEELGEVSLKNNPARPAILEEIASITRLGVDGKIGFDESLAQRLRLLQAHRDHLPKLVQRLKKKVSVSISRNKEFFHRYQGQIYIVSNGFKEFIEPVVAAYGIGPDYVLANTFTYDEEGNIVGADPENPLSRSGGKSKAIARLGLQGEIHVIGDAYTDYEIKAAGIGHKFYAFTENVLRQNILDLADHIAPSFDEFLYVNQLPMAISYPKNRIKVLLLENIHPRAVELFQAEGYQVETAPKALSEDELCERVRGVSILGIRSKTHVTARVLEHANRLMAIGAFCIGTNQIDLDACARRGIIAFNAPYSNTRSVVELAIGQMILLMRRIFPISEGMHRGQWQKSASGSHEIRGKKLGIIGYGNIGSQLSVLAEALGMQVIYYDLTEKLSLGNAVKAASLSELLKRSDIITLHVDGRKENRNFIGEKEFKQMKPGVIFLNLSRGHVVDIAALVKYLKKGHVVGASIDVFPQEPESNQDPFISELQGLDNVILTPHIGGSTQEAQANIAEYVPARLMDYINTGSSFASVNFPNLQLPAQQQGHRLIHIHENVPGILAQINRVLAEHQINIEGQYLKTSEEIGYVITDIDRQYSPEVLESLKRIAHTIKFRVLY
jgi:D-3-phosphoglycerate dehydrogenase